MAPRDAGGEISPPHTSITRCRSRPRLAQRSGRCLRTQRFSQFSSRRTHCNPNLSGPARMTPATPVLRSHAEQQFAAELEALAQMDDKPKPPNWKLSPWAVSTYLLGGD